MKLASALTIFALAFVFSLNVGSTDFSLASLWYGEIDAPTILLSIRLPRLIVACLVGASLAVAGVLTQGLFRNALASPSILGTSAGASSAAALNFYLGLSSWHWLSLPLSASLGAFLATGVVLLMARTRNIQGVTENLLLAGFALNAFFGAITSLLIAFVLDDYQKMSSLMYWLMGGLNARSWTHVQMGILPTALGLITAYIMCGKLNALILGEEIAATMSIHLTRLKTQVICIVALLVGGAIAIAGAIGFVGLIVPHISRRMVGAEHRRLLLFSAINGMTLLLLSDLMARTLFQPRELQVGIITALIGAPFFFYLLISERR